MEGADLQEEPWQQAKVVHGPQEPHRELQEHPGNQGEGPGGVVKVTVQGESLISSTAALNFRVHVLGRCPWGTGGA